MALSLLSGGLWAVAVVWQVVALGGGPAALSLVAALSAGGMLASTLLGGALADRIPQRRILLAVELRAGRGDGASSPRCPSPALLELWHLAAVSLVSGLAMGLYYPAYSALVPALRARRRPARGQRPGGRRPADAGAGGRARRSPGFLVAALLARRGAGGRGASAVARGRGVRRGAADDAGPPGAVHGGTGAPACSPTSARASSTWCARRGCWPRCCSPSLMLLVFIGPFEVLVPVRDQGRRGRAQPARAGCWPRSASAARSARWSWPRCGCRGAT